MVLVVVLVIDAPEVFVIENNRGVGEQTSGRRRYIRALGSGIGAVLAFVGAEIPKLVPLDRSAERAAILLIGERQYRLRNRIGCIEGRVAEVSKGPAVYGVSAGLGLNVDIDTRGAPRGGVEPVRHDLKLRRWRPERYEADRSPMQPSPAKTASHRR